MNRIALAASFATVLAITLGSCRAEAANYVSGFIGSNTLTDSNLKDTDLNDPWLKNGWELSFEPGFAIGGAVGTYMTPNIRAEFETMIRYNNFEEIGAEFGGLGFFAMTATTMVNAFYEWDVEGWRPYVGGGFGLGIVSLDMTLQWEGNKVVPAAQFGAGLATPLSENIDLTFDYRLLITKDAPGDFGFSADYIAHTVGVGLRYNF